MRRNQQGGAGAFLLLVIIVIIVIGAIAMANSSNTATTSVAGNTTQHASCAESVAEFAGSLHGVTIDTLVPGGGTTKEPLYAAATEMLGRASLTDCGPGLDHSASAGLVDWTLAAQQDGIVGPGVDPNDVAASLCGVVDKTHDTNICQSPLLQGVDGN